MTERRSFGSLLRQLRQERDLSQAQVGRPHYTRAYISALELGKANPSAEALDHIAGTLGVPFQLLLDSQLVEEARPRLFLDLAERCVQRNEADTASYVLDLMGPDDLKAQKYRFRYDVLRARVAILQREWEVARDWLMQAFHESSVQAHTEQALILYYEAVIHQLQDEVFEALEHYRTAYLFLTRAQDSRPELATDLNRNMGTAFWRLDQFAQAHWAYNNALESAKQLEDGRWAEAAALVGLANCFRYEEQYEDAVEANQRALAIYQELDQQEDQARVYNNLGVCYSRQGDFERAEKLLKRSLELREQEPRKAYSLNELAGIRFAQNELQAAEKLARQAMEVGLELGDRTERAYSHWILARVHRLKGQPEKALKEYYAAADLLVQVGNVARLAALQTEITSLVASVSSLAASLEVQNRRLRSVGKIVEDSPLHGLFQV